MIGFNRSAFARTRVPLKITLSESILIRTDV